MRGLASAFVVAVVLLVFGSSAEALGGSNFQALLNQDGSGQIFMNNGAQPEWKACRPDLTECSPFATTGDLNTAGAPPDTVFWDGGENRTPVWKGNVSPASPPSVEGEVRADAVVTPVAGHWTGGWETDYDELTLAFCKSSSGQECVTINHEGDWYACGGRGATLIDPAFTGWYVRVVDHRYGAGTVFAGVGHPFYFQDSEPTPGPTVSVAVVGQIAAATGPRQGNCAPPPLISGSISKVGAATFRCAVVGCHVTFIAKRGKRTVRHESTVAPALVGASTEPAPLRFSHGALHRLGKGPVRLSLRIDGKAVAGRRIAAAVADGPSGRTA
jgi:hypothetical protein